MRNNVSAINPAFAPTRAVAETRLDFGLLQRVFLVFGIAMVMASPFSRDPVAMAAGGVVPFVLTKIIGRPHMPAAVLYFLMWQWMQCFTRVLQGLIDGENLGAGVYGPFVEQAYWYTLGSTVVLAIAFALVLGRIRPPTPYLANVHKRWSLRDLMMIYVGSMVFSAACGFATKFIPGADQPLEAAAHFKILAMCMLFGTVLSTGKGRNVLLAVLVLETLSGFGGLFSDFKGAFIYLAITALMVRIRWTGPMAIVSVAMLAFMVVLSLWWTAVKTDYREFATGSSDSQNIKTDFSSRIGYLGNKAGGFDWDSASYALLLRLSYIDIFGSVIGVQSVAPEPAYFRQWSDAIEHATKPRFLFPGKPALSDTEVFIRLARGNASEAFRTGTSISVGYVAENYVDLGFPGLFGGVFAIGALIAGVLRYFMTRQLPWIVREGTALAIIYTIGHDGVEISLPKILGATLMSFVVWAIMARWGFPKIFNWLDRSVVQRGAR